MNGPMFTGIVTDIGEVVRVEKRGDTRFTIATAYAPESIAVGASHFLFGLLPHGH